MLKLDLLQWTNVFYIFQKVVFSFHNFFHNDYIIFIIFVIECLFAVIETLLRPPTILNRFYARELVNGFWRQASMMCSVANAISYPPPAAVPFRAER